MNARARGHRPSGQGRRWLLPALALLVALAAALAALSRGARGPEVTRAGRPDPAPSDRVTLPDEPDREGLPATTPGAIANTPAGGQAAPGGPAGGPAAAPAAPSSPWYDDKAREEFVLSLPERDRPFVLDLRGRSLLPGKLALRFDAPFKRLYLQLADLPLDAERAELTRLGVRLLEFVGSFTYVARIEAGRLEEVLELPWVRGVAEVEPRDKMSESLAQGRPGSWAVQADGRLALVVRCHEDLEFGEAADALGEAGAEVTASSFLFHRRLPLLAPADALESIAAIDGVALVAETAPPRAGANLVAAGLSNADDLWAAPYALSGAEVRLGIWDGGPVDAAHPEFGGRVTIVEGGTADSHATHVSGTMAAAGVYAPAHGMASAARIWSWDFNGDIAGEQAAGRATYALSASNNSWGYVTDSTWYGRYSIYAQELDALVRDTGLIVIKAAGNSGSAYDTVDTASAAKHVIVVGAVGDTGAIASFSSRGPCDDGRVKPDVSANGVGLTSSVPGGGYASYSGTSMATPTTTGCLALILQRYRAWFGADPSPAMARALLCHSARDAGNAGPDYLYGFGIVDARAAVDLIDDDAGPGARIFTGSLSHLGVNDRAVSVAAGTSQLKATLAWIDPPGSTSAAKALVNDLDLELVAPDGSLRYPFRLDPLAPSAPATAIGANSVDVVEQAVVAAPAAGVWTVRVRGTAVASGPQAYVLLLDGGAGAPPTWKISGRITGDASLIGGVSMALSGAASGVTLSASDGTWSFAGLADGAYTVAPSRAGVSFSPSSRSVTLAGADAAGQDFAASAPSVSVYVKDEVPDRAIPDNRSSALSRLVVADGGTIAGLRAYVAIRHPYRGDLRVTLTSPAGTVVVLHDRTGGSADDLVGWYDTELAPVGSLSAFVGQGTAGTWTLRIYDRKKRDIGVLDLWKLEIAR